MSGRSFWEDPAQVEAFAARAPDWRLLELLADYEGPARTRVLDLGCAGGRNAVVLAQRGSDFYAIDASRAMVERTRARVAAVLGAAEARRRVRLGRMDELDFASGSFDLVVALGVYQTAGSQAEWDRAIAETVRVLARGGRVLVASFTPASDPAGAGLRPVPGEAHVFEGFAAGPMYLLHADELDAAMARHGLEPAVPTETVTVATESGRRVTANGLYRLAGG